MFTFITMKKNVFTLIIALFISVFSKAQEKVVTPEMQFFTGTFQEALVKAKEENKLVFVDAYATWCGPCKMMKSQTFTDKKVIEFYNKHFINVAMDIEKGKGLKYAAPWGITHYPTLLYFNTSGEIIQNAIGFHNSWQFVELGEKVLKTK